MDIPLIVLVVDGNRDIRELHDALPGAGGFPLTKSGDAVAAFEYARYFHPDALANDEGELARLIVEVRAARERLAALLGSEIRRRPRRPHQRFYGH